MGAPAAAQLVYRGLRNLEYRGYDSCGIAWIGANGLETAKTVGGLERLSPNAKGRETVALGHTRWATHGGVTRENAHPHVDCMNRAAVVHNGVLLNYEALRDGLRSRGHEFRSETDSEVLVHLWEDRGRADPIRHLRALLGRLQGTYSVAILDVGQQAFYVAKQRNPLWVASGRGVTYLASDPVALRAHVSKAIPLEDGDHGRLTAGRIELFDTDGRAAKRKSQNIDHIDDHVEKAGYEHFMLKEILESPVALNRVLSRRVQLENPYFDLGIPSKFLGAVRRVLLLGAGTSYHAALLGVPYLQRLAGVAASAAPTPEYKDAREFPERGTLVVALSQSGETLDTLQAMNRLRSRPIKTLALTNHPTSSLARAADHVLPLESGMEIGVAATKSFLSQAFLLHLLALGLGRARGTLGDAALFHAAQQIKVFPRSLEQTFLRSSNAAELARELTNYDHVFVLAKDLLLPAAYEGALKLKEIAYQHAEAYPAGELKHGPFALLSPSTPVVFLIAPGPHEDSLRNSLHEVHARGPPTFVVAAEGAKDPGKLATRTFWIPAAPPELQPLVFASALHLVSYWVAKARGLPIDKPRHLAKSVTVE